MTPIQTMVWILVIVSTLATLGQTATVEVNLNDNFNAERHAAAERSRRDVVLRSFVDLLHRFTPILLPRTSTFNLFHWLRSPAKMSAARRDPQTVVVVQSPAPPPGGAAGASSSDAVMCDPPCTWTNECCLHTTTGPSCQKMITSGEGCGWPGHYTGSNPKATEVYYNATCPCMLGMLCFQVTNSETGVCGFF